MKYPMLIVAAALALPTPGRAADDDAKADLKKMEGTWEVVAMEVAGRKVGGGRGGVDKVVVKGGKMTYFAQGKPLGTFNDLKIELDPKKKPKALDVVQGKNEKGELLPCIYELGDDVLKIAMPLIPQERKPGERLPRPRSFETKRRAIMVVTARRSKS